MTFIPLCLVRLKTGACYSYWHVVVNLAVPDLNILHMVLVHYFIHWYCAVNRQLPELAR